MEDQNRYGFPPILDASHGKSKTEPELNPFRLPPDEQIFRMREEEKKKAIDFRERNKHLKIWDKQKSQTMSNVGRMTELVGDQKPKLLRDLNKTETKVPTMSSSRHQDKENMSEFIAKKREMFLVQMSLDTKREEIRKLEEKAQMKEEALQRSEQMLEEDAMRFDAFLKENDKKAHDAIKRAEEETKRKQEKIQEIKKLTQQIQALSSEMSKHKEALEDCLRYKEFLDMLTPPEWFEQHKRAEENRRLQMKVDSFERKYRAWENNKKRLQEQHKKEMESKREPKRDKRGRNIEHEEKEEKDELSPRLNIPPPPKLEDEPEPDFVARDAPMYFIKPQQLMDIFAALEEQNLFLIQNSQETEHTLEELRLAFRETKIAMHSQTEQLQQQIDDLQREIDIEEKRAQYLAEKRMNASESNQAASATSHLGKDKHININNAPDTVQNQFEKEQLLNELHSKVKSVYEQCGFDASSKPNTLFMLSQLEIKLEMLLNEIEKMPTDYVIKAEKEKEKKRREKKREEQQLLQEKLQEERNKRAIERSLQAPKKRQGRQVMFRSKPIRKELKNTGDDDTNKDNNDDQKYLS